MLPFYLITGIWGRTKVERRQLRHELKKEALWGR